MKHFILFFALTLSAFAEANVLRGTKIDAKTSAWLSKCKAAVEIIDKEMPDTIACPRVLKFISKEALTVAELKKLVQEELTFSLSSKTSDWTTIIPESFALQASFVNETLSEGSGQYSEKLEKKLRKALKTAETNVAALSQMLIYKGQSLGSKVFVDGNATWGTKVKAKAIVILNAPHRTVEVYLHGDLDG